MTVWNFRMYKRVDKGVQYYGALADLYAWSYDCIPIRMGQNCGKGEGLRRLKFLAFFFFFTAQLEDTIFYQLNGSNY